MRLQVFILSCLLCCLPLTLRAASFPELGVWQEVSVISMSIGIGVGGSYLLNQTNVPNSYPEKSELLPWDKPFAGTYSRTADYWSDAFLFLSMPLPLVIGALTCYNQQAELVDLGRLSVMFGEALILQSGLNLMIRSLQIWPRPYIYRSEKRKNSSGEAYGSLYSGHVSAAFTAAVFTTYAFDKLYPQSDKIFWVGFGSFSLASAVAVTRVAAGKHFPTDVLAGALAGSLVSFGIIQLHEWNNSKVRLDVSLGYAGISYRF